MIKEVINQGMFSILDRVLLAYPQGYFCPNYEAREFFKKKQVIGTCRACNEVFVYPLCGDLDANKHQRLAWGIYMSITNVGFRDGLDLCLRCREAYNRLRKKDKSFFRRKKKVTCGPTKAQINRSIELGLTKEVINYV